MNFLKLGVGNVKQPPTKTIGGCWYGITYILSNTKS